MSRIGKQPIQIPNSVTVSLEGNLARIKGPKGEITRLIPREIKVEAKDGALFITPAIQTKRTQALWGLARAILAHSVLGVSKGFEKKLELEGVGFRVNLEGKDLLLMVGFSHPVRFPAPPGIEFKVEKNVITVLGFDKELVGETSARIRALKKPEPYKGKGIRYQGEVIRRKAGKKVTAAAG